MTGIAIDNFKENGSRENGNGRRGFTLIELLIVIGIIVLLIAILIPSMEFVKKQAKNASTSALMNSIGIGLESYRNDFHYYPPSDPTGAYAGASPALDRGSLMLTEGLAGYLDFPLDGAGPSHAGDPPFGFRVSGNANGAIRGPYIRPEGSNWKILPSTNNMQQVYVDYWGSAEVAARWQDHEILYYRAVPSIVNNNRRDVTQVFGTKVSNNGDFKAIFVIDDNATAKQFVHGSESVIGSPALGSQAFFKLLGGGNNAAAPNTLAAGDVISGRDTYLLVSAGPDGQFFTSDDIVLMGK